MKNAIETTTNTSELFEGNFPLSTYDGLEKSIPFDKANLKKNVKKA